MIKITEEDIKILIESFSEFTDGQYFITSEAATHFYTIIEYLADIINLLSTRDQIHNFITNFNYSLNLETEFIVDLLDDDEFVMFQISIIDPLIYGEPDNNNNYTGGLLGYIKEAGRNTLNVADVYYGLYQEYPTLWEIIGDKLPPACLFEQTNEVTNESIITPKDLRPFNVDTIDELMRDKLKGWIFRPYCLNTIYNVLKYICDSFEDKADLCLEWLNNLPNAYPEPNLGVRIVQQVLNLILNHLLNDGIEVKILTFERLIPAIISNQYTDLNHILKLV